MNKGEIRALKEMQNVFGDVKFSREAWKSVGNAILANPAARQTIIATDKDGNPSIAQQIEEYSYTKLKRDIEALGEKGREPTELEMILQCQMIKARFDTNAAIFIRDTLGAKPIDETKVNAQVNNPYEQLTDEELEMIVKMREQKALEAKNIAIEGENVKKDGKDGTTEA